MQFRGEKIRAEKTGQERARGPASADAGAASPGTSPTFSRNYPSCGFFSQKIHCHDGQRQQAAFRIGKCSRPVPAEARIIDRKNRASGLD